MSSQPHTSHWRAGWAPSSPGNVLEGVGGPSRAPLLMANSGDQYLSVNRPWRTPPPPRRQKLSGTLARPPAAHKPTHPREPCCVAGGSAPPPHQAGRQLRHRQAVARTRPPRPLAPIPTASDLTWAPVWGPLEHAQSLTPVCKMVGSRGLCRPLLSSSSILGGLGHSVGGPSTCHKAG